MYQVLVTSIVVPDGESETAGALRVGVLPPTVTSVPICVHGRAGQRQRREVEHIHPDQPPGGAVARSSSR